MQQDISSLISQLYDDYGTMLYRISFSILLSKEDSEDVIQDVFSNYITKKPLHKDREHEKAWFIKVTINKCKDVCRKRKLRNYISIDSIPEPKIEEVKTDSIFDDVLSLPEKYKTVVILHYYESMSVEETAKTLNISMSSVKMRLLRGRKILKEKLEKKENRDD